MESQQSPNPSSSPIVHLAIGFVAGAIVVGSSWLTTRESTPSPNVVRDVTVTYMYETDPGSAGGNNDKPVDSIEFYPGYVVITEDTGRSNLFAVDRLRTFHFEPTAPN